MKILVTGAGGLLGSKVLEIARINSIDAVGFSHLEMDITNRNVINDIIGKERPDFVIHCAAITDVDYCEDHRKDAWDVNIIGTKNVLDACEKNGTKMILISTDFVFDGRKGMYKEDDIPNPINYYSLTKYESEKLVMNSDNFLIARTSVLYGVGSRKFVSWVMASLADKQKIEVYNDQYNSPTLNTDLAESLLTLCRKNASGLYHCAGSERISRYDFSLKIADIFGLDKGLISSVPSGMQKAERPRDTSLDVSKVKKDFGIQFSNAEQGLKKMRGEMKFI